MSAKILLNNLEIADNTTIDDLYYPRIQINKHGEIILAISKENTLTKGILIGLTLESKSKVEIGRKFDDWEVAGELKDYGLPMTITLQNQFR